MPRVSEGGLRRSSESTEADQVRAWAEEVLELLVALSVCAERAIEGMSAHLPLRSDGVMEELNRQYFGGILGTHEAAVAARRAECGAAAADAQGLRDAEPD